MNETLFIISMLGVFGCTVLTARLYGKHGLFVYAAIAAVLANVVTAKQVHVFGLDVAMGAILFSSVYLCTDILSEVYGKEEAKKAVNMGLLATLFYIAVTQVTIAFIPNQYDYANDSMQTLFSLSARISIPSVVMFYIANIIDVHLFSALKNRYPKALWLRNNVSTILCNCIENFLFMIGAFYGVYSMEECIVIALSTCFIETIVGLCDTPFVYLARKVAKR